MTTPHKHVDVLRAIADGKEVEYEHANSPGKWLADDLMFTSPITHPQLNWRIKPETVQVGRHSWPMPLREAPLPRTEYWVAMPSGIFRSSWSRDDTDFQRLKSGIIHLAKEAAEQHAAALRCINRGDIE